jgi:hypothetical protein
MWSGHMEEADRDSAPVSDLWKDDANGVMVFVSPVIMLISSAQWVDEPPRLVCCPAMTTFLVES